MPDPAMAGTLEEIHEPHDIGVDIGMRILQGMAHAGLRREIHDGIVMVGRKQFGHGLAVGDIQTAKAKPRLGLKTRKPRLLELHRVVIVQVINAGHGIPTREQPVGKRRADEPGGPGNQNMHITVLASYRTIIAARPKARMPKVPRHRIAPSRRRTPPRA